MKRVHIFRVSATILACACLGLVVQGCDRQASPKVLPSIVLITIDTLRADHLSTYGYFRETSPILDQLAREAAVFDKVVTTMATTLPAHVSLMTSTWTTTHGLKGNFSHLKTVLDEQTGLRTFAEILSELGYETAAFVSAAPVRAHTGLQRGFETYDQPVEKERRADVTTDKVLSWLEAESERPLFLWIHYFDPHRPRQPPAPYDKAFSTDDALVEFLRKRAVKNPANRHLQGQINAYDGEILFTDTQIGRVLAVLEARGDWQDTAVVITADHGEGLGQHDWMDHGQIYNEQLLVPLIIRFPIGSGPTGVRISKTASLVDVIPTLVGAFDIPVAGSDRPQFEGVDLLTDEDTRAGVFSEQSHRVNEPGLKYTLTGEDWKYFHRTEAEDELFDMVKDPHELDNVIERYPSVASSMREEIFQQLATSVRAKRPQQEQLDPEVVDQLRALGYLGGPGGAVNDGVPTWRGMVIWGHEVREFRPCESSEALWVVDETGELWDRYRELTQDSKPYTELYVEIHGEVESPPLDGFGSGYSESIRVDRVLRMNRDELGCRGS